MAHRSGKDPRKTEKEHRDAGSCGVRWSKGFGSSIQERRSARLPPVQQPQRHPGDFTTKEALDHPWFKKNKTKTTFCCPSPASLDANHIGPPTFCFPMYLHIWLPLGIKIWHWKIFGLKWFIINLEEKLSVCVCVFEGWLLIRFSFCNWGLKFRGMRTYKLLN